MLSVYDGLPRPPWARWCCWRVPPELVLRHRRRPLILLIGRYAPVDARAQGPRVEAAGVLAILEAVDREAGVGVHAHQCEPASSGGRRREGR
jgi:hypothetical protein